MIEDPDLKFMKEYFSETNNKVPLSPLCGLKLVNKIITDSLDEEYRLLLGLYLSNHNYREIADHGFAARLLEVDGKPQLIGV